jgi:glycosyltransferase involved in cell wall biosynthesis
MDRISVILRNRNEQEYIGFAIQSIIDYFESPEIVVVDNNSTDESLSIIEMFKHRSDIKILNVEQYSPGRALNQAIKHVKHDIVLVLSAHAQITEMDLEYVSTCLKNNVAVFGKQIPIYRGKKITPRYIWSHFIDHDVSNMYSDIEGRYFLHNAFCFYDRKYLLDNPFDETLVGKEDRYWAIEQVNKNYSYLYTPKIKVNHYWTPNGATWKGLA